MDGSMVAFFCYSIIIVSFHALVTSCTVKPLPPPEPINLEELLQPDDVDLYYSYSGDNTKRCARECVKGSASKICYYKFTLEDYASLTKACANCPQNISDCYLPQCITADGYERGILTVNRRMPGPAIQVCEGDRIIVDVTNAMLARTTTIHWHGVFQKGTQYNDGVPFVTQCPISEGGTFRYDFHAANAGTFFYHSHDGLQKLDGLQGNLVIRRAKEDEPNSDLYDYDLPAHVIFVNDWYHTAATQRFPGLLTHDVTTYATSYVISGRGRYVNPEYGNSTTTPYSVFRVKPGMRYRFRIVGAICTQCPASITFQDHNITVVATDGVAVKPVTVDSLVFRSGERFDIVLNATKEVKSYWIQVRGLFPCNFTKATQLAILQYEGSNSLEPKSAAPTYENYFPEGLRLNPPNATCNPGQNGICVSQLETAEPFPKRILKKEPDVNIPVTFGYFYPTMKQEFDSDEYHIYIQPEPTNLTINTWVNNIFMETPAMPILSQLKDIPDDAYCPINNITKFPYCPKPSNEQCNCYNVIKVPLHAVVQLVLIDKSNPGVLEHPFHLHGYAFNVMAMGHLREDIQTLENIVQLIKNNSITHQASPAFKDTIAVPNNGYSVMRIVADNPGYWFFHCHFVHHLVSGMSVVIQVGEPKDYPTVPDDFPKCGNYLPTVY